MPTKCDAHLLVHRTIDLAVGYEFIWVILFGEQLIHNLYLG